MPKKRLGRRERLKIKQAKLQSIQAADLRSAQVKANLSSKRPENTKGHSPDSKATLLAKSHTPGFRDTRNVLKMGERPKPIGGFRYVFQTPDGRTWGGCDRKAEIKQALERFKLFARDGKTGALNRIKVIDTKEGNS